MQLMQIIKLPLLALVVIYAAAQDIDKNDVPNECRSICIAVMQLTQTCDFQNDDHNSSFINCICSSNNAATLIPACEACVATYDRNDSRDNDVNDLVRSCSFATMTFVSGARTSAIPTGSSNGSGSMNTTSVLAGTTTLSDGSISITTTTSGGAIAATAGTDGDNNNDDINNTHNANGTSAGSSASPSKTDNAAVGLTVNMGVAATIFVAASGFLGLA